MKESINSISTMLPELLKQFNNSMESFDKVTEAITTSNETVALDLVDSNNNIKRIFIPSFGFLKGEIERLNNNIESLGGISTSQSNLRMPDGTFRKIFVTDIKREANDLKELNTITNFDIQNNYFFENFINPFMYVSFDITGQVSNDIEKIMVSKFILNLDTLTKKTWYDNNYKNKSDIQYSTFLKDIIDMKISYIPDDEIMDIPPRTIRYTGTFNVLRINDTNVEETINGVTIIKRRKLYKLNKLTYTDNDSKFSDTVSLRVGDHLIVNSSPLDTKYKITSIDSSTNSIVLELLEGQRSIQIGTNTLIFFNEKADTIEAQIGIGYDQYCVVFLKPIDPDSKIPAKNWSLGSSFYTNELQINVNGQTQKLETYYKNEVTDFSVFLRSMAKDNIPPSILAITPDIPILVDTNFEVVQINDHITANKSIKELETLHKDKISLENEIKEIDKAIFNKKETIATKNYKGNSSQKETDKTEQNKLITERNSKSQLFSSLIKQVDAKVKDQNLTDVKRKYHLRGYFPMPKPKYSIETGDQTIIQFIYAYRYLSKDGNLSNTKQYNFSDGGVEKRGTWSPWVEVEGKIRERIFDEVLNRYIWKEENPEDGDQNNINTIDIPISKGESIEIKVRTVSEAGWPSNPAKSDWSTIIRKDFPDNLGNEDALSQIVENNTIQLAQVNMQEDLSSKGVLQHISDSFTAKENYFAHDSTKIASGFLSPEQTPITLFDKLVSYETRLAQLEEILKKAKGNLVIKMIDENGNETLIKKNQLNKFFAGYYSDIVKDLDIKKGVIVSKTFFLTLENSEATTLELISRIPGSYTRKVNASEPSTSPNIIPASYSYYNNNSILIEGNPSYSSTDDTYNTKLKYDLVPIVLANPTTVDSEINVKNPFQSSQVKSQFIYCRYKDVASEEIFYSYDQPDMNGIETGTKITNVNDAEYSYGRTILGTSSLTTDFIWGANFNPSGDPYRANDFDSSIDDTIELHIEHPYIKNKTTFISMYNTITGTTLPDVIVDPWSTLAKQLFIQSRFAPLSASSKLGKKQNLYLYDASVTNAIDITNAGGTISDIVYNRTIKTSFDSNDQYLLGKRSCGCYLFLASNTHDDLIVDGKSAISIKELKFGSTNSIRIPIIFQFRMTDYWGQGSTGLGNIAGEKNATVTNIIYAKKMGIDLYDYNQNIFSFDIEISAKYKSDNLNLDKIPTRNIQAALDDVRQTLSSISPSIVETSSESSTSNRSGSK